MSEFKIGDLVWAKMKGFPLWPGLITDPPENIKAGLNMKKVDTNCHCIYFFGTHNYGLVEEHNLKPYLSYKKENISYTKSSKLKKAFEDIEDHIKNTGSNESEKLDKLPSSSEQKGDDKTNVDKMMLGLANFCPSIKLVKLKIDFDRQQTTTIEADESFDKLPSSSEQEEDDDSINADIAESNPQKRNLPMMKTSPKKKKFTKKKYSDADTTTPLDSNSMCESSFRESVESVKDSPVLDTTDTNEEHASESSEANMEPENSIEKTIPCPNLRFGFIGLGVIGRGIVKNLLKSNREIVIWNRTLEKASDFRSLGARIVSTPAAVVRETDIIFCCVSDAAASKEVMFGAVIHHLTPDKSYVDITSVDVDSSLDLSEAVFAKGCRYMEVRLQGSKKEAEEGTLISLAAGEQSLYTDCSYFFNSCCKKSIYMGAKVGTATKLHLIVQLMTGVTLAGLAESMALADRAGLQHDDLLKILSISNLNCPLIMNKANAMSEGNYETHLSLSNMQKDMNYAISLGDEEEQPTPMAATANELFKHAKKLGYGGRDVSSIILGARF